MKKVILSWHDAVSSDAWEDIAKAKELEMHVISQIGYLVYEDDRKVIIAGAWDPEREAVSSFWAIPKTWLLDMKEIECDG